jgi:hypothetical protein
VLEFDPMAAVTGANIALMPHLPARLELLRCLTRLEQVLLIQRRRLGVGLRDICRYALRRLGGRKLRRPLPIKRDDANHARRRRLPIERPRPSPIPG